MKEFEGKVTWTASEWEKLPWQTHGVYVTPPQSRTGQGVYVITHEDQIDQQIPDAPGDLKAYVRREVLRCRPTGEDEFRDSDGDLWKFRMRGGKLEWQCPKWFDGWYPPLEISRDRDYCAAARAWRDRQWRDVEGAEGYAIRKAVEPVNVDVHTRFVEAKDPRGQLVFYADELFKTLDSRIHLLPQPVIRDCCKLLGVEREAPKAKVTFDGKWESVDHKSNQVTFWCFKLPAYLPCGPVRVTI